MLKFLDFVSLKRDIVDVVDSTSRKVSLPAGAIGTVIEVYFDAIGYKPGELVAYEVEFLDEDGCTLGMLQLDEEDLELHYRRTDIND